MSGPSLEVLKQQNDRNANQIEKLTAENTALRAELKREARNPDEPMSILEQIAAALLLGEKASDPRTGIGERNGSRPESRFDSTTTPGASTRQARYHTNQLLLDLKAAVDRFNRAADHKFYPPRKAKELKVRCKNRNCEALEKRIPKFVGPPGGRIELIRCPKCDHALVDAT